MEFSVDVSAKKAFVTIINQSENNLVIPIDTISLRPYFNDICLDVAQHVNTYPTLGLNIRVKNNTGQILESSAGSVLVNDAKAAKVISREIALNDKRYQKEIKFWQKMNGIKSFDYAKINSYIFNHLYFLKPGERVEHIFYFDLHNITNSKYLHSYYHLENGKEYEISVSLTIEDCIYNYLTKEQKKKLIKYKLFTGIIESNTINYVEQ